MKYLLILFLLISLPTKAREEHIYMLGKAKFKGTTFTQIVLFQDKEIDTIQKCLEEKERGQRGYWRYYSHVVYRLRGMALSVNYYCISSEKVYSRWFWRNSYDYVYLTRLEGDTLKTKIKDTYANCITEMRETQSKESKTLFCAKANQKVIE